MCWLYVKWDAWRGPDKRGVALVKLQTFSISYGVTEREYAITGHVCIRKGNFSVLYDIFILCEIK